MTRSVHKRLDPMPMSAPLHVAIAVAEQQMGDAQCSIAYLRRAAQAPSLDLCATQAASVMCARLIGSRALTLDDGIALIKSLTTDRAERCAPHQVAHLARLAAQTCLDDSGRCTKQPAALYHRAAALAVLDAFCGDDGASKALRRQICAQAPTGRQVFSTDLISRVQGVHARTPTRDEAAAVRRYLTAAPLFRQLSTYLNGITAEGQILLATAALLGVLPAVFTFGAGVGMGVSLGVGIALGGIWASAILLAYVAQATLALVAARRKLGRNFCSAPQGSGMSGPSIAHDASAR